MSTLDYKEVWAIAEGLRDAVKDLDEDPREQDNYAKGYRRGLLVAAESIESVIKHNLYGHIA